MKIYRVLLLCSVVVFCFMCEEDPCELTGNMDLLCIIHSPIDKAIIGSGNVTLRWAELPSKFHDPVYKVFIGFKESGQKELATTKESYFDMSELIPDSTYYWHFTARDQCGYNCVSNTYSFSIVQNINMSIGDY